ncbi:MAG: serine protease, partial [Erysipelotrichia bacterium]|nr:serine protease [Erysipelotrichia bacterium]
MNIKKCVPPLLIILIFCFAGCTTKYNSLTNVKNGNMELIAASKAEVLSAAYNAISSEFPSTYINEINGYQSGFSWHHQPLLDATNFKLLVKKMTGITKDGTEVEGNSISVVTSGTQGLVESRYVAPLISKFENILLERGIKKVTIEKVTLSDDSNNNSNFDNQPIGTGTGFFISEEGDLITNYHVIKNATNISGILSDGKTIPLNIVLKDEINDIALLKANIKSKGLKILSSDAVIKGKEVFALGYPLVGIQGQEQKATFGRINELS